jgi:hypothetical protein
MNYPIIFFIKFLINFLRWIFSVKTRKHLEHRISSLLNGSTLSYLSRSLPRSGTARDRNQNSNRPHHRGRYNKIPTRRPRRHTVYIRPDRASNLVGKLCQRPLIIVVCVRNRGNGHFTTYNASDAGKLCQSEISIQTRASSCHLGSTRG